MPESAKRTREGRMEADHILVGVEGGLAAVTLDRPAKRNAVTLAMWRRLRDIFDGLGRDPDIRAIVLAGAGGHIAEFATVRDTVAAGAEYERAGEAALLAVRDCAKPTIAQLSGYCVGGGAALALACDFRVADGTARMGIPAARLGIVYGVV